MEAHSQVVALMVSPVHAPPNAPSSPLLKPGSRGSYSPTHGRGLGVHLAPMGPAQCAKGECQAWTNEEGALGRRCQLLEARGICNGQLCQLLIPKCSGQNIPTLIKLHMLEAASAGWGWGDHELSNWHLTELWTQFSGGSGATGQPTLTPHREGTV